MNQVVCYVHIIIKLFPISKLSLSTQTHNGDEIAPSLPPPFQQNMERSQVWYGLAMGFIFWTSAPQ